VLHVLSLILQICDKESKLFPLLYRGPLKSVIKKGIGILTGTIKGRGRGLQTEADAYL
jgi:hypothetical protein